jgi:hypothetical protein
VSTSPSEYSSPYSDPVARIRSLWPLLWGWFAAPGRLFTRAAGVRSDSAPATSHHPGALNSSDAVAAVPYNPFGYQERREGTGPTTARQPGLATKVPPPARKRGR